MSYGFDEICHRHLYLGNYSSISVESIKQYSITHVVNCTKDLPTPARIQGVKFIRVAVDDHPSSKIKKHFDSVLNKMFDAIKTGGKVLVICRAGISRSSTVVMAFLMKFHNMMLRDAHKLVKSQRPKIRPNDGFWRQLIDYERVLFKCSSVTLIRTMGGIVPSVYLNSTLNQNYMQIT